MPARFKMEFEFEWKTERRNGLRFVSACYGKMWSTRSRNCKTDNRVLILLFFSAGPGRWVLFIALRGETGGEWPCRLPDDSISRPVDLGPDKRWPVPLPVGANTSTWNEISSRENDDDPPPSADHRLDHCLLFFSALRSRVMSTLVAYYCRINWISPRPVIRPTL